VDLHDLTGRGARLDQLSRGLGKELARRWKRDDPLLYLERRELLAAQGQTHSGVERARVALAKACRRLRGE
jgi:hypothetical protein